MKTIEIYKDIARKKLLIYNVYFFAFFFALGTFLPWFPIYMKEAGLVKNEIGIILSFGPLIAIIFQPLWGIINDRFRLDKKIVYMGLILMNIFIFFILINDNFFIIAIYYLLFGLFSCGIGPIHDSFTVLYTRKYGFKYGDVRIWGSIGYAIASFISGYTIKYTGYLSITILSTVFYLIALIAFIKVKQVKMEVYKPIKKQSSLLTVLKNKVYLVFLIFVALSIGVLSATGNYTTLRITALGGSTTQIGLVTSITVLIEIITMLYVTKINNSVSDFRLLVISIIIQIPYLLVYILSNEVNLLLYILVIRGISSGLFIPVIVNFISSILPSNQISSGLVLYSALSINFTGYVITIMSGFIATWFSYQVLFSIFLIFVFISLLFAFLLNKMKKQVVEKI